MQPSHMQPGLPVHVPEAATAQTQNAQSTQCDGLTAGGRRICAIHPAVPIGLLGCHRRLTVLACTPGGTLVTLHSGGTLDHHANPVCLCVLSMYVLQAFQCMCKTHQKAWDALAAKAQQYQQCHQAFQKVHTVWARAQLGRHRA